MAIINEDCMGDDSCPKDYECEYRQDDGISICCPKKKPGKEFNFH